MESRGTKPIVFSVDPNNSESKRHSATFSNSNHGIESQCHNQVQRFSSTGAHKANAAVEIDPSSALQQLHEQMSSGHHQSLACSKNSVAWLFMVLSTIYIIYSFNLILHEHRPDCPTPPFQIQNLTASIKTSSPTSFPPPLTNNSSPITNSTDKSPLPVANLTSEPTNKSSLPVANLTSEPTNKSSSGLGVPTSNSSPIAADSNKTESISATTTNESLPSNHTQANEDPCEDQEQETQLKHLVFGLGGSSNLWEARKEYLKVWWRPGQTRGAVWLDQPVAVDEPDSLPEIRVSEDTSNFKYTHGIGMRSALRITRVVSEMVRLELSNVRWFVMGDDDTVFLVDNVVRTLNKYDHNQFYYVGSSSESHVQNIIFSYNMAFGGGGFAISYPLAKELAKMQDRCIQRYPGLYGSDDRIHACMTELGIPLTKEQGFHQYDVHGDLLGLLSAHPIAPLLSLHHLDVVDPIFPGMDRVQSVRKLFKSVSLDSPSIIQQSICYDQKREWSISISWGFVVQITRGILSPRELEMPTRTFLNWYQRADYTAYAINTRPVMKHPCQKPFIFYMNDTWIDGNRNQIFGFYSRDPSPSPECEWNSMESPEAIDSILVVKKPDPLRWQKSPRRDCCRILPSRNNRGLNLWVGNYKEGEVTEVD